MTSPSDPDRARAASQRRIGATILATVAAWAVAQFAGARLGIGLRWVALVDLAALAVLGWAVVSALALWRARKE